jgi:hypothetical protein
MLSQRSHMRWNKLFSFGSSLWLFLVILIASSYVESYSKRIAGTGSTTSLRRSLQQRRAEDVSFDQAADDEDGSGISTRIIIEPFQLQLSNATSTLTESELFTLRDTMEAVALTEIDINTLNISFSSGQIMGDIELLRFGGAQQVYNDEFHVVIVKFDFGVAQYSSLPTPIASMINDWLKKSFTTKLLPSLKQSSTISSSFQTITSVNYGLQSPEEPPLTGRNTTSGGGGTTDDAGDDSDGSDTGSSRTDSKSSSRSNVPVIAGATAGVAACIIAIILGFAARQRRHENNNIKTREITDTLDSLSPPEIDQSPSPSKSTNKKSKSRKGSGTDSNETSPSSSKGGNNDTPKQSKGTSDDGRSIADSESEWTVATEAGDTMALKSILPSALMANKNSANVASNKNDHHLNLVLSESFERDRKVAITKDMLTGQWSGRVSQSRNGATGGEQRQSESVLQPSHFSASQERRIRKAAQKRAALAANNNNNVGNTHCPDRETSSISSKGDESSVDESLVFEQAHEDAWAKKVQVSPSTTSKRRTRDISPPPPSNSAMGEIA